AAQSTYHLPPGPIGSVLDAFVPKGFTIFFKSYESDGQIYKGVVEEELGSGRRSASEQAIKNLAKAPIDDFDLRSPGLRGPFLVMETRRLHQIGPYFTSIPRFWLYKLLVEPLNYLSVYREAHTHQQKFLEERGRIVLPFNEYSFSEN